MTETVEPEEAPSFDFISKIADAIAKLLGLSGPSALIAIGVFCLLIGAFLFFVFKSTSRFAAAVSVFVMTVGTALLGIGVYERIYGFSVPSFAESVCFQGVYPREKETNDLLETISGSNYEWKPQLIAGELGPAEGSIVQVAGANRTILLFTKMDGSADYILKHMDTSTIAGQKIAFKYYWRLADTQGCGDISFDYGRLSVGYGLRWSEADPNNPRPYALVEAGTETVEVVVDDGEVPAEVAGSAPTLNRDVLLEKINDSLFGGDLKFSQIGGINALLDYWEQKYQGQDLRWIAYILGSVYHESGRTFQPIEEYGKGQGRPYGEVLENGNAYYGRGYIQIVWANSYIKVGEIIGVDIYTEPDLALDPEISAAIAVEGLVRGIFSGRPLSNFFSDDTDDWVGARRTVNGLDRAEQIAGYGKAFHQALLAAVPTN